MTLGRSVTVQENARTGAGPPDRPVGSVRRRFGQAAESGALAGRFHRRTAGLSGAPRRPGRRLDPGVGLGPRNVDASSAIFAPLHCLTPCCPVLAACVGDQPLERPLFGRPLAMDSSRVATVGCAGGTVCRASIEAPVGFAARANFLKVASHWPADGECVDEAISRRAMPNNLNTNCIKWQFKQYRPRRIPN